jgi:hypothetical protein
MSKNITQNIDFNNLGKGIRMQFSDKILSNPNFLRLVAILGDEYKAIGMIVVFDKLLKKFRLDGNNGIPDCFLPKSLELLHDVGIVEKSISELNDNNFYYHDAY